MTCRPAILLSIQINLEVLWKVEEQKNRLKKEILLAGEPFTAEVRLLITVRGITPLTALAILADVADIRRFKTLRKMNAYLGLVPRVKESGGRSSTGHINRESRRLTRTFAYPVGDALRGCITIPEIILFQPDIATGCRKGSNCSNSQDLWDDETDAARTGNISMDAAQ